MAAFPILQMFAVGCHKGAALGLSSTLFLRTIFSLTGIKDSWLCMLLTVYYTICWHHWWFKLFYIPLQTYRYFIKIMAIVAQIKVVINWIFLKVLTTSGKDFFSWQEIIFPTVEDFSTFLFFLECRAWVHYLTPALLYVINSWFQGLKSDREVTIEHWPPTYTLDNNIVHHSVQDGSN